MWLASSFGAGLVAWTLLEYLLHRFVFHERVLGVAASREHLRHHAEVSWFAPLSSKLALAAVVVGGPGALLALLLGGAVTAALVGGVVAGWLAYELLHRRIHVVAPRNSYGRWARRHHLGHHFGHSRFNHGVTSPLWDHVFGTARETGVVRIPRRHVDQFPWLAHAPPEAPWCADYVLGER